MRELRQYAGPALKIVCLILVALVACQLAGIFIRWNPFRGVTVPELPSLAAGTNRPAGGGHGTNLVATTASRGTNNLQHLSGTNTPTSVTNKNAVSPTMTALNGTNSAASTNVANQEANILLSTTATTNTAPPATGTNTTATAGVEVEMTNTNAETNAVAPAETKLSGTNSAPATNAPDMGTNVLPASLAIGTNAVASPKVKKKSAQAAPAPEMAGMNSNPFQPPGKHGGDLPPGVQARINRITDSEILGPVTHPLPMALMGIAGEFAFLRSASGQTGLVKEGDSLGDMKLLRIGINRVLIELDGQKKELTIFDGYGGSSLLPNNSTNENNHP